MNQLYLIRVHTLILDKIYPLFTQYRAKANIECRGKALLSVGNVVGTGYITQKTQYDKASATGHKILNNDLGWSMVSSYWAI